MSNRIHESWWGGIFREIFGLWLSAPAGWILVVGVAALSTRNGWLAILLGSVAFLLSLAWWLVVSWCLDRRLAPLAGFILGAFHMQERLNLDTDALVGALRGDHPLVAYFASERLTVTYLAAYLVASLALTVKTLAQRHRG